MSAALAGYRARLAQSDDGGERSRTEDAIALLTDYRISGLDAAEFEAVLSRMGNGRAPVALLASSPQAVAADVARRWRRFGAPARTAH